MPTFNQNFFEIVAQGGMQPSPANLLKSGPVIQVQIEVPDSLAAALQANNSLIPSPVDGMALIDTGATITSIDASVFARLGINPVGIANVGTANGPTQQSMFAAKFSFPGTGLPSFQLTQSLGCDLTGQTVLNQKPIIALIGRDILARSVLIYNGGNGSFSLSF